jgi:hypothetical protein
LSEFREKSDGVWKGSITLKSTAYPVVCHLLRGPIGWLNSVSSQKMQFINQSINHSAYAQMKNAMSSSLSQGMPLCLMHSYFFRIFILNIRLEMGISDNKLSTIKWIQPSKKKSENSEDLFDHDFQRLTDNLID